MGTCFLLYICISNPNKKLKVSQVAFFFWAIYYKSLTWSKVILGRFEVSSAEGAINCRDFWAEDEFLQKKKQTYTELAESFRMGNYKNDRYIWGDMGHPKALTKW